MHQVKIKKELKNDWWLFCDNYITIAELACREMIHQRYATSWHKEKGDIGPKRFWPYNLYISTIYNLKHSIEIFLKYFIIIIEDKIPEIGKNGHDIEKCLEIFKNKYKVDLINKTIQKAYDDKRESRRVLEPAKIETEFSKEWMENIAKISLKYFKCEDVKKKIKDFDLKDISNDAFRYPKNKLFIDINYSEIVNRITKEDIGKVLKDIGELKNDFDSLKFLIDIYHNIK